MFCNYLIFSKVTLSLRILLKYSVSSIERMVLVITDIKKRLSLFENSCTMGIKSFYEKYLSKLNIYVVVTIGFLALTFIAGDSNLYMRYKYDEKIRDLEKEIKYYKEEIETNQEKLNNLHTDKEGLERFAREEYFMKKEDEDIFIIQE